MIKRTRSLGVVLALLVALSARGEAKHSDTDHSTEKDYHGPSFGERVLFQESHSANRLIGEALDLVDGVALTGGPAISRQAIREMHDALALKMQELRGEIRAMALHDASCREEKRELIRDNEALNQLF